MIGMNLKYLRKKYGYSQEDLAERLEVSRQSVAKWENEESLPDVEKCVTMAQIFETTVEMLLVCPFYEEESDGLTSDGDGKYISELSRSAKGDRLHSLNTPERCSELRQATDFWFSVTRKRYGTCKNKKSL